jgi:Uncharacterized conserved protein
VKSKVQSAQKVLDTALELAEKRSWESVRLHEVAQAAEISLDTIRTYFREKEDLVDAWFDRADNAMLEDSAHPDFLALSGKQRLHRAIIAWLDALAPHRRVTREMILGKLEPGHLHIQIPAIMRISRTVQWLREAAHRDAAYLRRALEETALTSIYLMTFAYWMWDDSRNSIRTRAFLERWLTLAESASHCVFGEKYRVAEAGGSSRTAPEQTPSPSSQTR